MFTFSLSPSPSSTPCRPPSPSNGGCRGVPPLATLSGGDRVERVLLDHCPPLIDGGGQGMRRRMYSPTPWFFSLCLLPSDSRTGRPLGHGGWLLHLSFSSTTLPRPSRSPSYAPQRQQGIPPAPFPLTAFIYSASASRRAERTLPPRPFPPQQRRLVVEYFSFDLVQCLLLDDLFPSSMRMPRQPPLLKLVSSASALRRMKRRLPPQPSTPRPRLIVVASIFCC